jgi:hypothetical protein
VAARRTVRAAFSGATLRVIRALELFKKTIAAGVSLRRLIFSLNSQKKPAPTNLGRLQNYLNAYRLPVIRAFA